MKRICQITVVFLLVCIFWACGPQKPGEQYVRQTIPIEVQNGKTVSIEMQTSGNGWNDVGIRCSPDIWKALTNSTKCIAVQLKASDKRDTEIAWVFPPSNPSGPLYLIPDVHYIFKIGGGYNAKALVEIVFLSGPAEASRAELIVCKTVADTGL